MYEQDKPHHTRVMLRCTRTTSTSDDYTTLYDLHTHRQRCIFLFVDFTPIVGNQQINPKLIIKHIVPLYLPLPGSLSDRNKVLISATKNIS